MKTALLVSALTLAAIAANAQSFSTTNSENTAPNNSAVSVNVGNLVSTTTPRAVIVKPFNNMFIWAVGSATSTSATVEYRLKDGTVLNSETINITQTPTLFVSRTSPFGFQAVRVSPTAGLSASNSVSVTIVTTPVYAR